MQTVPEEKTNRAAEDVAESAALGLRERKKLETRQAIANAALKLFDQQGFHNTTIAQIAAAANVAPRTVSSYFPVKEELAFPDHRSTIEALSTRLAQREPGSSALAALREWINDSMSIWERDAEEMHLARRVVEAEPELKAYERIIVGEIMDALRIEIARDLGQDEDDLGPRMAAAATMAVFEVVGDHFKRGPEPAAEAAHGGLRAELDRQIDRAIRFVAAGIEALGGKTDRSES